MSSAPDQYLQARLGSWDRHDAVRNNLLRAIPAGALEVMALESGPSVAQQLMKGGEPHEMPPWPERARE